MPGLQTKLLEPKDRIFVSIDVDTLDEAKRLMDQCVGLVGNVKFGLQLATAESWQAGIAAAHERGLEVFCDTKFKDIPHTVEHAAASLARHEPEYLTIMADNNMDALRAARKGVDEAGVEAKPKLVGVTVLTSIAPVDCIGIYGDDTQTKVMQFGVQALTAAFDAIVCSAAEVKEFRKDERFANTLLITPGVRPEWAASDDQSRVATPAQAILAGADMLVIGRPITHPPQSIGSMKAAIEKITAEMAAAL